MANTNQFDQLETQAKKIVAQAKQDIEKLKGDITKLQYRGVLQLTYTPPGMPGIDKEQQNKDIAKIEKNMGIFERNALAEVTNLIVLLPPQQQERIKQEAQKTLEQAAGKPKDPQPERIVSRAGLQQQPEQTKPAIQSRFIGNVRVIQTQQMPQVRSRFSGGLKHSKNMMKEKEVGKIAAQVGRTRILQGKEK